LSLFGLAKKSSYQIVFEQKLKKGKKISKTDKVILLSEKLDVSYDHMVSLKLDNNLAQLEKF
jgi:hypothetical protein